ncbi:IS1 family transposase [Aeromonas caviae]
MQFKCALRYCFSCSVELHGKVIGAFIERHHLN